ncbi:MAG: VanW family protein [Defluviitaleaceae bacterium]|nr:VanW family protein [Defluviitaleaceae bacterium]
MVQKPKYRSELRLALGRRYFTVKRYFLWLFGGYKFAHKSEEILPYEIKSHSTPLYRKLKDVDMYLQENKVINLKIAIEKLQNVTINPGETFSYWRLIGNPTKRKGYLIGMVLKSGKVTEGTGGGLCQLSNLIYWLTIHTPLTVTERHRHGYDVFPDSARKQPFGSGATCFYNYGDLMIKNETDRIYQLKLSIDKENLNGTWLSNTPPQEYYEIYESNHLMKSEFWGGYTRHNEIRRKKLTTDGKLANDEFVVENHAIMMYSPFIASPL